MESTSETLLEQLKQPDRPAAWERFVKLYYPLLFAWARKKLPNDADAADLVQDVLVVLVKKLPEFKYGTLNGAARSFRGWLRTIVINKANDFFRKHRVAIQNGTVLADIPDLSEADFLDEREYRLQLVLGVLELLKPEFASSWPAFWEHGWKGRLAKDVAAELGMTEGAVYAAKCRVLARLRTEIQGLDE